LKTDQKDYPGIEAAVLATVEELAPDFDIVYSSFNWYTLQRLKALAPGAKIAALVEEALLPYLSHLPVLEPTAIHLDRQLFQDEALRANFKHWPIRLWTVNDPADWAYYASLAQDGHLEAIMTDTPAAALVVRNQGEACHD
ncbi:glycerophosphodiester phosphodiesterase family protein, partial [Abiotrophia defectiva]